jgi:hypothetical protein
VKLRLFLKYVKIRRPPEAYMDFVNWSIHNFIHYKYRNRLKCTKAEKLVYVYSNRRLLNKVHDISYEQDSIDWATWGEESEDTECPLITLLI